MLRRWAQQDKCVDWMQGVEKKGLELVSGSGLYD